MFHFVAEIFGIETQSVSHKERFISGAGALCGVLFVFISSQYIVDQFASLLIIASMGASAVLLFAVPHGALSQPWAVIGGHTISALVGVTCASLIHNQVISASVAVGLAVTIMYYLRCIHPPGGATAMTAVIGGQSVHQLGYGFAFAPIFLNAVSIVIIAVLFNALFEWRRYPAFINKRKNKRQRELAENGSPLTSTIAHEDFVYALSEIGTFIDVDETDLLRIYDLATGKSEGVRTHSVSLAKNKFYSNGEFGELWSIRKIIEINSEDKDIDAEVLFQIVAGHGRRRSGKSTVAEFRKWAAYEVYRDEDNWRRLDQAQCR